MRLALLCSVFLLFSANCLFAQKAQIADGDNKNIPELLVQLDQAITNKELATYCHELANAYLNHDHDSALFYIRQEKKYLTEAPIKTIVANWFTNGVCFEKLHHQDSVQFYFHKVIDQKLYNDHHYRGNLKLAESYHNEGKIEFAKNILDLVESEIDQYKGINKFRLPATQGRIYMEKDSRRCLNYYQQAIKLVPSPHTTELKKELAVMYNNMGLSIQSPNPVQAYQYFQKSLSYVHAGFGPESEFKGGVYNNLGTNAYFYDKKNLDYKKGIKYLKQALEHKMFSGLTHDSPLFHSSYQNLGEAFLCANEFDSALYYFQKVIILRVPDFSSMDYRDNPNKDQLYLSNIKMKLRNQFDYKCQALKKWYEKTKDTSIPPLILNTYQRLDLLIDLIRREHLETKTKKYWREQTFHYYEDAIQACLAYGYLQEALYFSEKAKAILLLEEINGKLANTAIPHEIRNNQKRIHQSINNAQDSLTNPIEYGVDSHQFSHIKSRILDGKFELEKISKELEKYPDYVGIHYEDQAPIIQQRISQLKPDEMILEYFWGDHNHYIFSITKDRIQIDTLGKDTMLIHQIDSFKNLIANHGQNSESEFARLSYLLFNKLIKPVGPLPARLTIIPDDVLFYLPFGILIKQEITTDKPSYFSLSYLNQKHEIRNAFSIALLHKMESQKVVNHQFISIAPSYSVAASPETTSRSGLQPLIYNQTLSDFLAINWHSISLSNQYASIDSFISLAPNAGHINMSMHAILNDTLPEMSYLAFSNYLDEYKLHLEDIYQLDLNAELITLNACETGIGKLQRGEGMISLGRSFIYAGTRSLVTTQWKVNDLATARIMKSFYQNLKKGYSKSKSLQFAQQEYLQQASNTTSHPYYWSAFVLNGANNPIIRKWWISPLFIGLTVLSTLFLFFILFKKGSK